MQSRWKTAIAVIILLTTVTSAYAATTITIKDTNTTVTGGTYYYSGNFDFFTDSHFNLTNKILNSKGHLYNVSFSNLQAAINDVIDNAKNHWVYTPRTTITFTGALNLTSRLTWYGYGTYCILGNGVDTRMAYVYGANTPYPPAGYTGYQNVTILGVTFDCNNNSGNNHNSGALDFQPWTSDITVRDCTFLRNGRKSVIDCEEMTWGITIENNKIMQSEWAGYGGGIWFAGHDCICRNNYIKDVYACGVTCESDWWPTQRILVEGNYVTGVVAVGLDMERQDAQNCTIVNNVVIDINSTCYIPTNNWYSTGITLGKNSICTGNYIRNVHLGAFGLSYANNTIIANNVVETVQKSDGAGVYFSAGFKCENVTIKGNSFYDMAGATSTGVLVQSIDKNITITGNKFSKLANNGISFAGAGGIISDNSFVNVGGRSISISGKRVLVDSNYIENNLGSYAIYDNYPITISNNVIYRAANYGIYLKPDSSMNGKGAMIVTGNRVNKTGGAGIYIDGTTTFYSYAIISNNGVQDCAADGIYLSDLENASVTGNVVVGRAVASGQGFDLVNVKNSVISSNIAHGFTDGLKESGTANLNIIGFNNLKFNTNPLTTVGAGDVTDNNLIS